MAYMISLKKSAEKELEQLPKKIHKRIIELLISLKQEPRPFGIKKLKGQKGYRLRVGNYRVLYVIHDPKKNVEIFSIGHRKDIYR